MHFQARKQIILRTVEDRGSVEVKELAQLLGTSEITVRRDLGILTEKGLIYRTHGGAMKVSLAREPLAFANKTAVHAERKDYICELAARYVQEGDIVFMDCGSTVFRLCPFIRSKSITVVTNSLPVVHELMGSEVQLNLAGGEVDAERQAIHGAIMAEHLGRYRADKAFIGVDGISLAHGLSARSETEAATTLALARQARQVYLLCDSSKLEQDRYFQFAPLSLVHTLITDREAPESLLDRYRKAGLVVINQ